MLNLALSGKERGGMATIMVLAFMVLAVPFSIAAVQTAGQFNRSTVVYDDRIERMFCNGAGVEHAIFRLVHEPGFADSLTVTNPSASYSITQCNINVSVTVIRKSASASGTGGESIGTVDYTVQAGHEIEVHLTVDDDSQDDMWFAYDTVGEPSWVDLPSPANGDMKLYLHNIPTPPTGDTAAQHPLPTDATAPAATTLYNYDFDRDAFPGLLLAKSDEGTEETDPTKYQEWQTAPLASPFHIDGEINSNWWLGMKDFSDDKTGVVSLCIRDKDGSSYTDIACAESSLSSWTPGEFSTLFVTDVFDVEATSGQGVTHARVELFGGQVIVHSWDVQ